MRRVQHIMGMPVAIDIPACRDSAIFEQLFARLRAIDAQFSPYIPTSELSRYQRGTVTHPSADLQHIITACQDAKARTNGYFAATRNGVFDPTGYVKGWAIAQVAHMIGREGYDRFFVNIGGDIALNGNGTPWRVGIQHPTLPDRLATTLLLDSGSVATSGAYERGAHITNPHTGRTPKTWSSVTVAGPDIIWADVLATALFAAGKKAPSVLAAWPGYEALLIGDNGQLLATPGITAKMQTAR